MTASHELPVFFCPIQLIAMRDSSDTHLLVIAPQPASISNLVSLLRACFSRVSFALGAQQGLVRCQTLMPDLILSVFELPDLRGDMFMRMLRATPQTAGIPVVFISSVHCYKTEIQALRSGAKDFFHCKTNEDLILERIKLHLPKRQRLQESQESSASETTKDTVFSPRVSAARQFIEDHLSSALSAESLGALFGISDRRLNDEFRDSTGLSVHEFVRTMRMQHAMRLLVQSDITITQIAAEIGYLNPANFATAFRQYSGHSPSFYRRQYRIKKINKADNNN